ncbi:MAG: bifunctional oligoribonuclease/PAP phosphatase NrnA [Deltaproteobacteria bacterium]|nr:bifunctional oligoribonuclease/PAP phosphatase NrnA [Deltaproteobacteria bacterium]
MKAIVEEIRRGQRFLVATHVNPEGDALGSLLGLGLCLRGLGKRVTFFDCDPVPAYLGFLPGAEEIVHDGAALADYDAAFIVDCGTLDRLGEGFTKIRGIRKLINLDHHLTNHGFADLSYVDPKACATGEVVYRLMKAIPASLTREIALCLYTAIVTDTGSFRYSNTTPEVHQIVAELLQYGVDPWEVSLHLFESDPPQRIALLGEVLATLELRAGGRLAAVHVTQAMLRAHQATPDLTEGFVNYTRGIRGVEVGLLFRELPDGTHKVSLRSKGRVNVAEVAEEFGGGGHANAAGCAIKGDLAAARERMFAVVERRLAGLGPCAT